MTLYWETFEFNFMALLCFVNRVTSTDFEQLMKSCLLIDCTKVLCCALDCLSNVLMAFFYKGTVTQVEIIL